MANFRCWDSFYVLCRARYESLPSTFTRSAIALSRRSKSTLLKVLRCQPYCLIIWRVLMLANLFSFLVITLFSTAVHSVCLNISTAAGRSRMRIGIPLLSFIWNQLYILWDTKVWQLFPVSLDSRLRQRLKTRRIAPFYLTFELIKNIIMHAKI